jgi:hypothetical protein
MGFDSRTCDECHVFYDDNYDYEGGREYPIACHIDGECFYWCAHCRTTLDILPIIAADHSAYCHGILLPFDDNRFEHHPLIDEAVHKLIKSTESKTIGCVVFVGAWMNLCPTHARADYCESTTEEDDDDDESEDHDGDDDDDDEEEDDDAHKDGRSTDDGDCKRKPWSEVWEDACAVERGADGGADWRIIPMQTKDTAEFRRAYKRMLTQLFTQLYAMVDSPSLRCEYFGTDGYTARRITELDREISVALRKINRFRQSDRFVALAEASLPFVHRFDPVRGPSSFLAAALFLILGYEDALFDGIERSTGTTSPSLRLLRDDITMAFNREWRRARLAHGTCTKNTPTAATPAPA